MASKISITIKYDDGSRSLTEVFQAADSHPAADVVKSCEEELLNKWQAMGHSIRGLEFKTTITPVS